MSETTDTPTDPIDQPATDAPDAPPADAPPADVAPATPAAPPAAPPSPPTMRQVLAAQGKLDDDCRIGNIVINTNMGIAACAPEYGKVVDGEFELSSTLGELRLSPEGVKELRALKGKPDENVLTTLKKFFMAQLVKKLDEPVTAQQVVQG